MTATAYVLSLTHDTHVVTMTNGSGTKDLVLTGSEYAVWVWCCRAGEVRDGDLAGYVPVGIRRASLGEKFDACTCPRGSENYSLTCPVDGFSVLQPVALARLDIP
jgi:hypothetical protein